MTIFQKMLLVPILSFLLYGSFITYSFFEHQKSSQKIQELRNNYLPAIDLLNDNIHLFVKLRDTFKDAVLAQESLWIANNFQIKERIEDNFLILKTYPIIIDQQLLKQTTEDFHHYYLSANTLAKSLLKKKDFLLSDSQLIQNVEQSLNLSLNNFDNMKTSAQQNFTATINTTSQSMNQLIFWGGIIIAFSMLILISVTISLSLSTRKSFITIVNRTRSLALGDTDFSKRLSRSSSDELALLIHWFNKLSDKLEADYIKLKTLSITDKLTQLNNRTRTDQFLPATITNAAINNEPLALVIIDIDHFKAVNDNYGHLVGDEVLQLFAKELKSSAKSGDYVSRWGGEEFVLVWQNISLARAIEKANAIRLAIEKVAFPSVGTVTASFGLTIALSDDTVETLISRADHNLYRAKEKGRNCVVLDN